MRSLLLLACLVGGATAGLASDFTDTVEIRPGFAEVWRAPLGFTRVHVGDPNLVDVTPENDQTLVITAKGKGGATNILLMGADGKQVANLQVRALVPATWGLAQSARDGHLHVYWRGAACFPNCEPAPPKIASRPPTDLASAPEQAPAGAAD